MSKLSKITRRRFLQGAGSAAAVAAYPGSAISQSSYPSRTISLVVAYPPGGSTDTLARIFAKSFSAAIGQPVIVENRPGAGGINGTDQAARAKADGYTLLWNPTSSAIIPALNKALPFDPVESFRQVGRVGTGPLVLVVNSKLPVKSVKEFIAYAKSQPGKLNYATPGVGTIVHLSFELFNSMAGTDIVHIPYNGNGPAYTDVASGVTQAIFSNLGYALTLTEDGPLRPIAITTPQRNALALNLPTFEESGLPGFEVREWFGLVTPKDVPDDVFDTIHKAFQQANASEELRSGIGKLGYVPIAESPADFRAAVVREIEQWKKVADKAGIKA
jgi:tripartite-type tricarboxylate transporter receptor subunit TctC